MFGEAAHCFRDLARPAETEAFATASLEEAARQGRARRGALSYAARAISHLHRREVEQAADDGTRVLELTKQVESSRARETVLDLYRRLHPHQAILEVEGFMEHVRTEFGIAA